VKVDRRTQSWARKVVVVDRVGEDIAFGHKAGTKAETAEENM
jgi:hypothetical protein